MQDNDGRNNKDLVISAVDDTKVCNYRGCTSDQVEDVTVDVSPSHYIVLTLCGAHVKAISGAEA